MYGFASRLSNQIPRTELGSAAETRPVTDPAAAESKRGRKAPASRRTRRG